NGPGHRNVPAPFAARRDFQAPVELGEPSVCRRQSVVLPPREGLSAPQALRRAGRGTVGKPARRVAQAQKGGSRGWWRGTRALLQSEQLLARLALQVLRALWNDLGSSAERRVSEVRPAREASVAL